MRHVSEISVLIVASMLIFTASAQNSTEEEDTFTLSSEPSNTSISAGKLLQMNVSTPRAASDNWAGVFGNVTAQYLVGQQSNTSFFSWKLLSANYVYASSEPVDFDSDWKKANHSQMKDQYNFLENTSETPSDTFNYTNGTVDSDFQSDKVENSVSAKTFNQSGKPYWETVYLSDGDTGFFAGPVKSGLSFQGLKSDYQMILPENGADSNGTSYDLYLEVE